MENLIEQALQYVRDNKTWSEEAERKALKIMNEQRCSLDYANFKICDEIHDIMEEFSDNNELPEGWWYNEFDETDIFLKL